MRSKSCTQPRSDAIALHSDRFCCHRAVSVAAQRAVVGHGALQVRFGGVPPDVPG